MQHEPDMDEAMARDQFRHTIMAVFCDILRRSGLPPMTVLRLAAGAVGSVYHEVAEAHQGPNACPCGWEPSKVPDIEALQDALAEKAPPRAAFDLRSMRTTGTA